MSGIWLGLAALIAQQEPAPARIAFLDDTIVAHRVAGAEVVILPPGPDAALVNFSLEIEVSPRGEVVDARLPTPGGCEEEAQYDRWAICLRPDGTPSADPAAAIALVRGWKFRPFTYRGRPVTAVGTVKVQYQAPDAAPAPGASAPFPRIDYRSLKITLKRAACINGACPDYAVTIDGAGNIVFSTRATPIDPTTGRIRGGRDGDYSTLVPGVHRARIGRAALDALIARFRDAGFFGLRRVYGGAYGYDVAQLTFESGGRRWQVTDIGGALAGMPHVVRQLEWQVDQTAGSDRWIWGNGDTVPALRREGFDFRSPAAQRIRGGPAGYMPEQTLLAIIEAGYPLGARDIFASDGRAVGATLVRDAIAHSQPAVMARLAELGWLARVPKEQLGQWFAEHAGGCSPAIARLVADAGVDVDTRLRGSGGSDGTALHYASITYGPCQRRPDRIAIVRGLLAAGADPNAVEDDGETAIFGAADPDILDLLLAAGARVDVRDRRGRSAVFAAWSDAAMLRLLEAGADFSGADFYDGQQRGFREQIERRDDRPATRAWLAAHPEK